MPDADRILRLRRLATQPLDTPGVTRIEALRMGGNGVVRQQAIAALLDMRAATRQEQAA